MSSNNWLEGPGPWWCQNFCYCSQKPFEAYEERAEATMLSAAMFLHVLFPLPGIPHLYLTRSYLVLFKLFACFFFWTTNSSWNDLYGVMRHMSKSWVTGCYIVYDWGACFRHPSDLRKDSQINPCQSSKTFWSQCGTLVPTRLSHHLLPPLSLHVWSVSGLAPTDSVLSTSLLCPLFFLIHEFSWETEYFMWDKEKHICNRKTKLWKEKTTF